MSYLEELIKKNEEKFNKKNKSNEFDELLLNSKLNHLYELIDILFDKSFFIAYVEDSARFENLFDVYDGILVFDSDKLDKDKYHELINQIRSNLRINKANVLLKGMDIFYTEIKDQNNPEFYFSILNNKKEIYVSRGIDARFFYGDNDLFENFKINLVSKIQENKEVEKQLKIKNEEYKRIVKTGIYSFNGEIKAITRQGPNNENLFLISYDNKELLGLKNGFLRLIQSYVNLKIIEMIKDESINKYNFINLNSDFISKINLLRSKDKIDENKLDQLINAYDFFLEIQHDIKEIFFDHYDMFHKLETKKLTRKEIYFGLGDYCYETIMSLSGEKLESIQFYKDFLINEL